MSEPWGQIIDSSTSTDQESDYTFVASSRSSDDSSSVCHDQDEMVITLTGVRICPIVESRANNVLMALLCSNLEN